MRDRTEGKGGTERGGQGRNEKRKGGKGREEKQGKRERDKAGDGTNKRNRKTAILTKFELRRLLYLLADQHQIWHARLNP